VYIVGSSAIFAMESCPTEKTSLLHEAGANTTARKRNILLPVLEGIAAIGVIFAIGIIFVPIRHYEPRHNHTSHHEHENAKTCLTPECIHASSEILYNLSPKYQELDPCKDFEELVCGGWSDRHDLRPDQGDAFTGTQMAENSQMLLRHILEARYPKGSDVSPRPKIEAFMMAVRGCYLSPQETLLIVSLAFLFLTNAAFRQRQVI
jgi:hypothetical protein